MYMKRSQMEKKYTFSQSHTTGRRIRSERKMKPTCLQTYKLKCSGKYNEDERMIFF